MPDYATKDELDSLRAMLSDVLARQNHVTPSDTATVDETPTAVLQVPFWEYTQTSSAITLTQGIGDDWEPRFDDLSVCTTRRKSRKVTSAGELQHIHIGSPIGKRFRIAWDSDTAQTIQGYLSGMPAGTTGGYIQLKFNGQLYEYDLTAGADYYITLEGIVGRNCLVVSVQYGPFYPIFEAVLFDGKTSRWVDPTELSGYVKN